MKIEAKTITVQQRDGKDPPIKVTIRRHIPTKKYKTTKPKGQKREPIDYGVTRDQYFQVLDKAVQPKKDDEGSGNGTRTG